MNEKEHAELNEWIQINVFGWHKAKELEFPYRDGYLKDGEDFLLLCDAPDYVNEPAAAMEVLKRCLLKHGMITAHSNGEDFGFDSQSIGFSEAKTPELAICFFSKKIFTK